MDSIGNGKGQFYSINFPIKQGITDKMYLPVFKRVIRKVLEHFQPNIIVMQCGADSIVYDKLGNFNLTTMGHGECVQYVLNFGYPIIMLGGGGYTVIFNLLIDILILFWFINLQTKINILLLKVENVARCWTYETAIALNEKLDNDIPHKDLYYNEYYKPDYKLHIQVWIHLIK